MAVKKVIMSVDQKFFENVFEKERRKLQEKIGVLNLSQAKFTRMITGFKIKELKPDLLQVKPKRRGRKKNIL